MHNSASNGIFVTDDGAIRSYWRGWGGSLFWITGGLFLLGMGIWGIMNSLPSCMLLISFPPGLLLLYLGIGSAINYTEFRNEGGELFIQHKPLPWLGNKSIPIMEINDISVKGFTISAEGTSEAGIRYHVIAGTKNGSTTTLMSDLSLDDSEALVSELERSLGKPRKSETDEQISTLKEGAIRARTERMRRMPLGLLTMFLVGVFFLIFFRDSIAPGASLIGLSVIGIPFLIWFRRRAKKG